MSEGIDSALAQAREARHSRYREETAPKLRDVAYFIETMARAMDEDDDILGALAGEGLANHLPALPQAVRHTFMDYLSDEAAAGFVADQRYWAQSDSAGVA